MSDFVGEASAPENQRQLVRAGAAATGTLAGQVALLHETDAHGWLNAPWIQEVPGVEHSSSFTGGWAVGLVTVAASDMVAARFYNRGNEVAASSISQAGRAVAWAGSVATQLAIELNVRGVTDKWDFVAGMIGTLAGVLHGSLVGPRFRRRQDS